jgi:hypothetical protein
MSTLLVSDQFCNRGLEQGRSSSDTPGSFGCATKFRTCHWMKMYGWRTTRSINDRWQWYIESWICWMMPENELDSLELGWSSSGSHKQAHTGPWLLIPGHSWYEHFDFLTTGQAAWIFSKAGSQMGQISCPLPRFGEVAGGGLRARTMFECPAGWGWKSHLDQQTTKTSSPPKKNNKPKTT